MLLYFALTVSVSVLALLSDLARRQLRRPRDGGAERSWRFGFSDLVILGVLIVIPGARYFVGTDFYIYWNVFQSLEHKDWQSSIENSPHELGYTLFSLAVKSAWTEPQAIIWASSAAAIIPMYLGIIRLTTNRALSIFLYLSLGFYFTGFNQVRQAIALGLTVLAFSYFRQSRVIYVTIMIIAASFHVSAIVVPLVQFLTARWRATFGRLVLIGTAIGTLALALSYLGELFGVLNDRYEGYVEAAEIAGVGTLVLGAIRAFSAVIGALTARRADSLRAGVSSCRDQLLNLYTIYVFCGAGLIFLGYISVPAARLEQYFSIYMIFLLPIVFSLTRVPKTLIWLATAGLLPFMYLFLATFNGILPYQTAGGFLVGF